MKNALFSRKLRDFTTEKGVKKAVKSGIIPTGDKLKTKRSPAKKTTKPLWAGRLAEIPLW
jgi:hypothetical protein